MYGKKTESDSFTFLRSYRNNFLFEQDIENNTTTISTNFLNFATNCQVGMSSAGTVPNSVASTFSVIWLLCKKCILVVF